jgi:hypothetical protein
VGGHRRRCTRTPTPSSRGQHLLPHLLGPRTAPSPSARSRRRYGRRCGAPSAPTSWARRTRTTTRWTRSGSPSPRARSPRWSASSRSPTEEWLEILEQRRRPLGPVNFPEDRRPRRAGAGERHDGASWSTTSAARSTGRPDPHDEQDAARGAGRVASAGRGHRRGRRRAGYSAEEIAALREQGVIEYRGTPPARGNLAIRNARAVRPRPG